MADCTLNIQDISISRYQFVVFYEKGWVLKDGDGKKLSTNGTWLLAENDFEIFDGLAFKAAQTLFKAKLSNPSVSLT